MRVVLPCPIADPAHGPSNSSARSSRLGWFEQAERETAMTLKTHGRYRYSPICGRPH